MVITVSVSLEAVPVWFEGRDLLNYGIRKLNGRELDIFNKYFIEQMTMAEIAIDYSLSRTRICQIVRGIKVKIRRRIVGQAS